jgi:hypothetical protein
LNDDIEFNVWSTSDDNQPNNNYPQAPEFGLFTDQHTTINGHSNNASVLRARRQHSPLSRLPRSHATPPPSFTRQRMRSPSPTSPNYPLRLAGRKYLPGKTPGNMDAARKAVRDLFPDSSLLAPIQHGNQHFSSSSLPSRFKERSRSTSEDTDSTSVHFDTNERTSKNNAMSSFNATQLHHILFDTSPIQIALKKTSQKKYKKQVPYGPVYGQDALYKGPKRFQRTASSATLGRSTSLEPIGRNEIKFHEIMSRNRITRREIPTRTRKVLRNRLHHSRSSVDVAGGSNQAPVKAGKGVLNLSKSLGALRAERNLGLTMQEIGNITEFALQTVIDPFKDDIEGRTVGGGRVPSPSVLAHNYLEHDLKDDLKERQKSRQLDGMISRERSKQQSRTENRHRSRTPIDMAHTRMSKKKIHNQKIVNIDADFGSRKNFDIDGNNVKMARGGRW